MAHKTGALAEHDPGRVVVDNTVEPKTIAHPADAPLFHRALERLVDLAKRNNVPLRQSYLREIRGIASEKHQSTFNFSIPQHTLPGECQEFRW